MVIKLPVVRLKRIEFKLPKLFKSKVEDTAGTRSMLELEYKVAQLSDLLVEEVSRLDAAIKALSSTTDGVKNEPSQRFNDLQQGVVSLAQTVLELDDRLSKLES